MEHRRSNALGEFAVLPDEIVCSILRSLGPRDVGAMACVSSVFYILCNEEPLWMELCLKNHEGPFVYKGSWKCTASNRTFAEPLHFGGFSSMYLYRRWCRSNMRLENFFFDTGAVERRPSLPKDEFLAQYDGRKPLLLTGLTDSWPARETWTVPQLVHRFGDTHFVVSQPYGERLRMKLKDYADYMAAQHDENPLYIFDASFGESAPELLQDYTVPDVFQEDFLSVLSSSQRPPFRWLVIGPARSGASWHVDPALTSAWNTLLSGRKRWALYPPGKVPPSFTVHVSEDDGDIDYKGPTSLQWWLDVYPHLEDDAKPLEFTQYPGETIYVPSGWWHCVLNIDDTVAVTQNYVNSTNLELVCIDMAPGFHHRGVARAGALAMKEHREVVGLSNFHSNDLLENLDTLKLYIGEHPDHFLSETNKDGYLNKRDLRDWLRKLQVVKPDLKEKIWKCACIAVDASTWLDRMTSICKAHDLPLPSEGQKIPVGNGSSPVYLLDEYVVKLYVHEDGFPAALLEFNTELEFYDTVRRSGSSFQQVVPKVIASGILYQKDCLYVAAPEHVAEQDEDFWPYSVLERCEGDNLAQCRELMSEQNFLELADFLGHQLWHLHSLPLPPQYPGSASESDGWSCQVPLHWQKFTDLVRGHRQTVLKRLTEWGSVPQHLLETVDAYLPKDPVELIGISKVENGLAIPTRDPVWLHMDIMGDNIQMVARQSETSVMQPTHILDFGDVLLGDPLYELVPMHTEVFEVNEILLERFLASYKLPLHANLRTSYRLMCYCLLYKYDAMDIIFRVHKDLRMVATWEQLETRLWGLLNSNK